MEIKIQKTHHKSKRTPIVALKVPNDQRPQALLSGQNIHVRFFSAMQIKKCP